jgi:outer membrane protein
MTAVRRWTTIICLSLTATNLTAQTSTTTQPQTRTTTTAARTTEAVTAETDRDIADPRALQITLHDAIQTALQRNLGVVIERYSAQMAGESLRSSYGLYDWFADGTLEQEQVRNPTTSTFQINESKTANLFLGLSQNLPAGGSYTVGMNAPRQTVVGGGTTISPAYNPSLSFQATQPLLRNFGVDVTRRGITIARNNLGIGREAFRQGLMDGTVSVERAYLDLVYARRNVEVVKEALFLARDQSRITQIRIDVGASAPLDILQPRVQIATTEESLIVAVASVRSAEDRLRQLMNLDPSEWDRPIIPTDPVDYQPVTIDLPTSVQRAVATRPELQQAQLSTKNRDVQYMYSRNQTRPQFDFNMNYRVAGIGGREQIIDNGVPTGRFTSSGIGGAFGQVFSLDFPTWTFGFTVGVPVTNIGAKAESKRAQLDLEQSRLNRTNLEQQIVVEVRQAARDVDTAARTIAASRAAREAAEQNLEAERRRYENGMTTNFQVLQIQQDLSDARVRELQALVGYRAALSLYHRAVGDILEVNNVLVDQPKVEEPRYFSLFDRLTWLNRDRPTTEQPAQGSMNEVTPNVVVTPNPGVTNH